MRRRHPFKENVVQHTFTIADDNGVSAGVLVSLTIPSASPLPADAYPAIAEATAAVNALAKALKLVVAGQATPKPDVSREMGGEQETSGSVQQGLGEAPRPEPQTSCSCSPDLDYCFCDAWSDQ